MANLRGSASIANSLQYNDINNDMIIMMVIII